MAINTTTSEEKDHAEYSASGSSRWLNCPGSHMRSKRYPPLPESKYATEGTQAHACLEFLLNNRSNLKAASVLALKTYPRDQVDHALDAVDYVLTRAAELPGSEIIAETKVDASPFTCPGQFGTLDIAIAQPFGRLIVMDYKFGAGIGVDPREDDGRLNSQLAYYALGMSFMHDHNFDSVELVVVQPRAFHASGETTRSTVATMEELLSWIQVFKDGVVATLFPEPLVSGKWCKFCPASIDCPELKDKSFKQAQIAFSDSQGIIGDLPAVQSIPHLGTILNACDRLEDWIAKARAHAIDVLERGGVVDGYKLVEKRGTRKWIDETVTMQEALDVWGSESHAPPELLSPAQFEKKFKKPGKDWVASRVTTIVSGTTLATADDKRPAVNGLDKIFGVLDV